MASDKPFLQSPFDAIGLEDEGDGVLPGQLKARSAPDVAPLKSAPSTTSAPSAPVEPAAAGRLPTRADVAARARQLGVDPNLALSIFGAESSGNFKSRDSFKGAVGGMQVMPATYRQMMGTDDGQRDPWRNMEAGLRYLAHGQKVLGTSDPALLAAGYHAGYGRAELRRGEIPNTHDGLSSTRAYAQKVAAGAGKQSAPVTPADEGSRYVPLSDDDIARYEQESSRYVPLTADEIKGLNLAPAPNGAAPALPIDVPQVQAKAPEGFFDRAGDALAHGKDNVLSSLGLARFAVAGGDSAEMSRSLAAKFASDAARSKTKTAGQMENDAAFQAVSDAKGAWDTTVAGVKAVGTALSNPKDTAVEILGQAPNMLPTIGAGVAGAGGGAAIGAGVGSIAPGPGTAAGAVTGALVGGRAGMAAGTTATELGAEVEQMIGERLQAMKAAPTEQNIRAVLDDPAFMGEARERGLKKGLTVALVDQVFLGVGGKIAGKAAGAATKAGKAGYAAGAVGVDASGEVIGEAASQKVARGHVDAGEALREGVMSLGQSVVEPAVGAAMQAGRAAVGPGAPLDQPVPDAPPAQPPRQVPPSGPLSSATERAAEQHAQTSGEFSTIVQGEDGKQYSYDGETGELTEIAPSGPLAGALDGVAEQHAQETGGENGSLDREQDIQPQSVMPGDAGAQGQVAIDQTVAPAAQPAELPGLQAGAPTIEDAVQPAPAGAEGDGARADQDPLPAGEEAAPAAPNLAEPGGDAPKASSPKPLTEMSDDELRARLKYIAEQNKINGGANGMTAKARREVEREINARAKASTKAAKEQSDARFDPTGVRLLDGPVPGAQAVAPAGPDQQAGRASDQKPGRGRQAAAGAPVANAGPDVPGASEPADAKPALSRPGLPETVHAGPMSFKPRAIDKVLYRETNLDGLDGLLRYHNQGDVSQAFLADNEDLAIGQGANRGVKVQFRAGTVSGREHAKPGTGDIAGREYRADFIGPDAIDKITMPKGQKLRGLTRQRLAQHFDKTELPDGRVQYVRKGVVMDEPAAPPRNHLDAARAKHARQDEVVRQAAENIAKRKAAQTPAQSETFRIGERSALDGFSMHAPLNIRRKAEREQWEAGWLKGKQKRDDLLDGKQPVVVGGRTAVPVLDRRHQPVWRDESAGKDYNSDEDARSALEAKVSADRELDDALNLTSRDANTQELEHAGARLYRTRVKRGEGATDMWSVESPDNQQRRAKGERAIGGDTLHSTLDEAKEAAERQRREIEGRTDWERTQSQADERDAQARRELAADDYSGFLADKAPNVKALSRKALGKQYRFNGDVMTVRERIDALHAAGELEVSTFDEPKIKPMSRAQFNRASGVEQAAHERKMREAGSKVTYLVGNSELGKTAYDYAQHLLSAKKQQQRDAADIEPNTPQVMASTDLGAGAGGRQDEGADAAPAAQEVAEVAPQAKQQPKPAPASQVEQADEQSEADDDLADIPLAFMRKTKVPMDVWIVDEGTYDTVDIPADKALASVREDIDNLRALLGCLKG